MHSPMKVIQLSHSDAGSGAGRAAHRLHRSLIELGLDSHMLVSDRRTEDPTVSTVNRHWGARLRARGAEYLEARLGRQAARSASTFISQSRLGHFNAARHPLVRAADVVGLFWINGAFVAPEGLKGIRQPIIWRLSDAWPFTGGCHYPGDCQRHRESCGHCPELRRPGSHDATYRLWQRKAAAWGQLNLSVVAPSHWLAGLAGQSALFAERNIVVIPTGIDLERYRPLDRARARARFGLPSDRSIIAFGALSPADDPRKGYRELSAAMQGLAALRPQSDVMAVVFGQDAALPPDFPVPLHSVGRLSHDEDLAAIYSAADVVAVPSLEDNLPNVALEAIACGAAVTGFAVGGMPEIVRQGWNGLLAPRGDSVALADALATIIAGPELRSLMSARSREHAEQHFCARAQALQFKALYESCLAAAGAA